MQQQQEEKESTVAAAAEEYILRLQQFVTQHQHLPLQQQRELWLQQNRTHSASSSSSSPSSSKKQRLITRASLTKMGFDLDNINKRGRHGMIPMHYFCYTGNLRMCRYLFFRRGADCSKVDKWGRFPMYIAAENGHLDIVQFLCHECDAHEDIRRLNNFGTSPLRIALNSGHFEVVYWLVRNRALAPRNAVAGGDFDDGIMRRDLVPRNDGTDKREAILAWAQDAVTTHDDFQDQLVLTGTILFPDEDVPEILKIITDFVVGTPQQIRTLRQLTELLPRFLNDVP